MYFRWREDSSDDSWGSDGVASLSTMQSNLDHFSEQQLLQFSDIANQGPSSRSRFALQFTRSFLPTASTSS
jgi:hypothetical protein